MPTNLLTPLQQPFRPEWIKAWDGAFSAEQRESCLWLYEAIVSRVPNLVRAALRLGARVNTSLIDGGIHADLHVHGPLSLAVWLDTNDAHGERQPAVDNRGNLRPTSGIVPLLLAAGAAPFGTLTYVLDQPAWEDVQHPLFVQLETAKLDRLASGDDRFSIPTAKEHQDDEARGWTYLRGSVVADHPGHNAHLWLHRAILRHRWDVLDQWWEHDGVPGVVGGDSALALLWQQRFRSTLPPASDTPAGRRRKATGRDRLPPVPASPTLPAPGPITDKVLHRELAHLRPSLLQAREPIYRQEVLALLGLVLGPTGPLDPAQGQAALAWANALLKDRPLASYALQDSDVADRRRQSFLATEPLRGFLIEAEQRLLRAATPRSRSASKGAASPGTVPESPARRRL